MKRALGTLFTFQHARAVWCSDLKRPFPVEAEERKSRRGGDSPCEALQSLAGLGEEVGGGVQMPTRAQVDTEKQRLGASGATAGGVSFASVAPLANPAHSSATLSGTTSAEDENDDRTTKAALCALPLHSKERSAAHLSSRPRHDVRS